MVRVGNAVMIDLRFSCSFEGACFHNKWLSAFLFQNLEYTSLATEKETFLPEMQQTSIPNIYEEHGKVNEVLPSASKITSVPRCKDGYNSDAESDVDDVKPYVLLR